jgi:hypothetical protein
MDRLMRRFELVSRRSALCDWHAWERWLDSQMREQPWQWRAALLFEDFHYEVRVTEVWRDPWRMERAAYEYLRRLGLPMETRQKTMDGKEAWRRAHRSRRPA